MINSLILNIILSTPIIFGLSLISFGVHKHSDHFEKSKWPTAVAKVVTSQVVLAKSKAATRARMREVNVYEAHIVASYSVEGQEYFYKRGSEGPGAQYRDQRLALELVEKNKPGTELTVRFNPESPEDSAMFIPKPMAAYLLYGAGLFVILLGVALMWVANTRVKSKQSALATT